MEIWFNPKCSKCRMTTEALDAAGVSYTLRRYREDPPTVAELDETLRALDLEPWDITRMGEPAAKELGLADRPRDRADWIEVLAAHPELVQRPIVVTDDGSAWITRDADAVQAVVDRSTT